MTTTVLTDYHQASMSCPAPTMQKLTKFCMGDGTTNRIWVDLVDTRVDTRRKTKNHGTTRTRSHGIMTVNHGKTEIRSHDKKRNPSQRIHVLPFQKM